MSLPSALPDDEIERLHRAMLAETMRPCRELSRSERADQHARGPARLTEAPMALRQVV